MPFRQKKIELTQSQKLKLAEEKFDRICSIGYDRNVSHILRNRAIRKLVQQGVNPNRPTVLEEPALHVAAMMDDVSLAKTLLDLGADINLKNYVGKTALHRAYKSPKIVNFLIERGVNDKIKDNAGRLPHELFDEKTLEAYYRATNSRLKKLVE